MPRNTPAAVATLLDWLQLKPETSFSLEPQDAGVMLPPSLQTPEGTCRPTTVSDQRVVACCAHRPPVLYLIAAARAFDVLSGYLWRASAQVFRDVGFLYCFGSRAGEVARV